MDEVLDGIDCLERKIERMEKSYVEVTNELIKVTKIHTLTIERLGEALALAKSPNEKDLEQFAALREAYDKYDFVRKLTLGEDS